MKLIHDYFKFSVFILVVILAGFSGVDACQQNGELKNDTEAYLKKGECHEYILNAPANSYLEIAAQQKGVDIRLSLLEGNAEIKSADSENVNSGYEFIVLIAPKAAKYKVQLKWLDDSRAFVGNEGFYKLKFETRPATEADRLSVEKFETAAIFYAKATEARYAVNQNAVNGYLSAAAIYKSLPQNEIFKYRLALTNYYLGVSYAAARRYEEATAVLQENAALASRIPDKFLESLSLKELGAIFYKLGNFQRSAEVLEDAVALLEKLQLEKIGEKHALPGAYILLAEASLNLNKTERAVSLLETLRLNHKEPQEEYLKASVKLADVYLDLNLREKAEQTLLLVTLPDGADDNIKGHFNKVSGKLYMKTDKEKALQFFNKAFLNFSDDGREQNEIKMFIGNALYYARDFQGAKNYFEQAKIGFEQLNDKRNLAQTLNNLGVISFNRDEIQSAIALCENALMINTENPNELNRARNLINLMYFQEAGGNDIYAIFYGKWAINTIHSIRFEQLQSLEKDVQDTFQDSFTDAFRKLANILIREGRLSEAEQVLRFIKEKEYQDYMRGNGKLGEINYSKGEEEILRQIKTRIEKKTPNLPNESIKNEKSSGVFSPTKQLIKNLQAQNVDVSDIVFISTLVAKDSVSIILTTDNRQRAFTQNITKENLSKLVFEFRAAVTDTGKNPKIAGKKLYDLLVKPLETELAQAKATKIVWSLDGVLRYVSIPALYDGSAYLVQRFANIQITFASDEKVLFPKVPNPTAIGLASSKPFENLSSLPAAKNELDCIFEDGRKLIINSTCAKGLIKGKKVADEEFTQETFEAALKNYQLIHFTSHFVLQAGDNSKSFLLLGGGKNRKYTMQEFASQQLDNVEIMIMSACDTANFSTDGAEFESFATMAQKQGAKAILGTLWSVADISTSKFMREFYWFYQIKKTDKADAIRKAQIVVAGDKNFSHPFFWAPFVLFGNWK
ncbi:MAG TPA: CHAT domain-containing protein [Pyrinomonadaceae bacterium]|jgi:CHAT domain-containing protein